MNRKLAKQILTIGYGIFAIGIVAYGIDQTLVEFATVDPKYYWTAGVLALPIVTSVMSLSVILAIYLGRKKSLVWFWAGFPAIFVCMLFFFLILGFLLFPNSVTLP